MIEQDTIMIDTTGERIGQVNGLSVYDIGYHSFGRPTRITAAVGMGKAGITSIEREANLSGKIHDKGVMTLSGYLREKFAKEKALTLSASIAFEQSYSGVDGDSASSTELYALLSSLSNLPIRQGIAVTGSVNQKGDIATDRRGEPEDRRVLSSLQIEGIDQRPGRHHTTAQCERPRPSR